MPLAPLPIDAVLPALVAALRARPCAVVQAPTGAGKTTRVPPALLDAGLAGAGEILVLEPRRLAARAAARRMAEERGDRLGGAVGYHVRFDRQAGRQTRILAVTPGILLRRLHDDPFLETAGAVVFDEFHERGLESDLALGLVRLVQQTVRPELRLVAMSATLDTAAVAAYLGGCPVIASQGRTFPVTVRYDPKPQEQPWPEAAAAAAARLLDATPGDLLVFLPGMQEIRQAARALEGAAAARDLAVLPLHGDLPPEEQDAALRPLGRRKVVLATNVAETSVTVEGVTAVVDTGLARQLLYDPAVGLDRLALVPISRASADQRAGRAGRTQPGVCVRLWSEVHHRGRAEQTEPEIRRVDLAGAVLHLLSLGESRLDAFPWLEPPPAAAVAQALELLRNLGALEGGAITDLGQTLARLPVHPRLGRLLVEGHRLGHLDRAALAAALLAERDPFRRDGGAPTPTVSDVLDRVEALEAFEAKGGTASSLGTLHAGPARFLLRARDQLARTVRQELGTPPPAHHGAEEALLRALLAAFPDRVARRREAGGRKAVMVGGGGVILGRESGVTGAEFFVAVDVDARPTEALVRLASAVERAWLPTTTAAAVVFDPVTSKVVARRQTRYRDLVLDEVSCALPDAVTVGRVLAEAAAGQLAQVLPAADSPAQEYRLRVRCLREWMPELGLPALDEAELREALGWLAVGCKSFAELRSADWLGAFKGRLTGAQLQAVEREAPERIAVPSGSRLALRYEEGRPPVLAVRIQEVFGLRDTPRIAGGRVRVLLHLLGPNYRPQQVTDDLASFWANTYPLIRKELRARYPKHAWPEDPYAAPAERRPQRHRPTSS